MNETRTTTAHLVLGDDDILRIYPIENAVITLEDAKNHFAASSRLTEGKKALILSYSNVNYKVTREAQKYSASQSHTRLATAIISTKSYVKWSTWIYALLMKPKSPIKVFNTEENAIAWLKTFQ